MKISALESTTLQATEISSRSRPYSDRRFCFYGGMKSLSAAIKTQLQLRKPKAVSIWLLLSCYPAKPGF